jgi:hypothetical protein
MPVENNSERNNKTTEEIILNEREPSMAEEEQFSRIRHIHNCTHKEEIAGEKIFLSLHSNEWHSAGSTKVMFGGVCSMDGEMREHEDTL